MCGSVLSPPMEHILSLPGGCVLPVPRTQVGGSLSKGCVLPVPRTQVGGSLSKEGRPGVAPRRGTF